MDKLIVNGPAHLAGEIKISKAKNAYLPILAAVLLSDKPVHLKNLPKLRDIQTMKKLLGHLGVEVEEKGEITTFNAANVTSVEATYDLVKTMRASIFVLGPLLSRFKKAKVSLPGGCAIGTRPIDLHLTNLKKLGVAYELKSGYVSCEAKNLKGANVVLAFPSVGATENLMMAAVFAEGETIIDNAALEPEVTDLAHFLMALGAPIEGVGTKTLKIQGIKEVKEITYEAIGDRIEAGTYLMAGLMTQSELSITGFVPHHIDFVIDKLREAGAKIDVFKEGIKVYPSTLKPLNIDTAPYPGFPTDLQAQMMALMLTIKGPSIITENIFENRFMHVPELERLGADISLKGKSAIINGGKKLVPAPIMCTDLRASAALILAALYCEGETEIRRVYHLDRGYEDLENKFTQVGVKIKRYTSAVDEEGRPDDCLFCKIIEEKIASEKVFENDLVLGFKDISPMAKEHYLFVHKGHSTDINNMIEKNPNQVIHIYKAINEFTSGTELEEKGFRVVTNMGPRAGQSVFHTHFHLLGGEQLGRFGGRDS